MPQLNMRIDDETQKRLDRLAAATGRPKTFYATEALHAYLEDWEDYFMAKDALDEFRQSDDAAVAAEDMDWGP